MSRKLFEGHALDVAPQLLGAIISVDGESGPVSIRITEVEAYHGVGVPGPYDPGSHSKDRKTPRNASMFGPPGHAYVYFNYGMHYALNLVCSPEHTASGVLIRSGQVVAGEGVARLRRAQKQRRYRREQGGHAPTIPSYMLARGPGNLATSLGVTSDEHDGCDLFAFPFRFERSEGAVQIVRGPRVGVSGPAGGDAFPWRFWIPGDRTVSAYRPGKNVPRGVDVR